MQTTAEPPRRFRFTDTDGKGSWVTHYFGTIGAGDGSAPFPAVGTLHPVAFLVEMDPDRTLRPHFHTANQFQIFVRGSGAFAKKPLDGVSLHYADAYSPYGPIRSGADGLAYLTLRNGWDSGMQYMPEARAELRAAQRKPRSAVIAPASDFEPAADGLCAVQRHVPPGAALTGPDPAGGGGQFWVELPATRTPEAAWQPAVSIAFVAPHDARRTVVAGSAGSDVFVLQFPRFA